MNWPNQNKWIAGGIGLTLLLMGLVSVTSYKNIIALRENTQKVQKTYEIINHITRFYASMTVAESGRRGYIATGNQPELERHLKAVTQMQSELMILEQQMDNADHLQQQKLQQLISLVHQRLALLKQSIELYQSNPLDMQAQNSITVKSVNLREKILKLLAEIEAQEEALLQNWLSHSRSHFESRVLLTLIGTALSFLIIYSMFLILYFQWKQYQKLEKMKQSLSHEKELTELKNKLFSMISHEFRTPLSVILSSSQLLETTLSEALNQRQLKNLYRIQSSVKLMDQFLTDVLTLTRADSGRLDYNLELLDIEAFCLNLVEDMQFLGGESYLIKFIRKGFCKRLYFDQKLLYSILSNLILNAIKYSPHGGDIYLILLCEESVTTFQVKDEGIGILPEDQPKIYEPFYRGQNVDRIKGTGLGLAVVQKCLERHQGTIAVESTISKGTVFTVKIPCHF